MSLVPSHLKAFSLAAALAAGSVCAQEVKVRRSIPAITDPVAGVGLDGVRISLPGPSVPGQPDPLLPWDQVASISGPFKESAAAFASIADTSWRARTRLERGDLAGAEPLFERLFPEYCGRRGPMGQLVCGGLLLCRIGRGATTSAVEPFLGFLNACEGDASPRVPTRTTSSSDPADYSPIDREWQLCPALPPIWLTGVALQTSVRSPWRTFPDRIGRLAELYRLSQACEFEEVTTQIPAMPDAADRSARLVWEIVASRAGDESTRLHAREVLRDRLAAASPAPAWMQAWCRCAIGRSLLREADDELRLLGIAELLAVPAAFEHAVPYVTGLCMAEAAVALAAMGNTKEAIVIRTRLSERFAGHPALEWEPLAVIGRATPAKSGGAP